METWIIYVATAVVILILGTLIQERIADKKAKKVAQNKPAEEAQPTAAVVSESTKQTTPATNKTGTEILTDFLTQMGCFVEESESRDEWTYRVFLCQGAHFESYSNNINEEILLYYHWCVPYSRDNYLWVQRICNQLSNKNKYVHVTHRYDSERDMLDVVIKVGTINPSTEELKYHFHTIFEVARELLMENDNRDQVSEEERIDQSRDQALSLRVKQYNEPMQIMANYKHFNARSLSISQLIQSLYDKEQVEDLLSMTIVTEQDTEQESQRDAIARTDVFSTMIQQSDGAIHVSTTPTVITIDTTFHHYTFTLHLVKQTVDGIFLRLTAVKVAYDHLQKQTPSLVYTPQAVSCLLCYETNDENTFEHFGEKIAAARQAERSGEELTEEQKELLDLNQSKDDYYYTEGVRMALHQQYLQAIQLLEPYYLRASQQYDGNETKYLWHATRSAYYLALSYYHLGQLEKAYYYIHLVHHYGRIDAHYLYFNILFEKQDVRLLHELETVKDQLEAELHKMAIRDEPLNEHEQWNYDQKEAYYLFLYRMHTEILIREQRYQLAYDHLHYLSQYEQTEEYALSRMEELDKIIPPEE